MSFLNQENWDRIQAANQVLQVLWDYLESRGENVEVPQRDPGLAGALYWVGTCRPCRTDRKKDTAMEKLDGVIWSPGHGGWVCERHLIHPDAGATAGIRQGQPTNPISGEVGKGLGSRDFPGDALNPDVQAEGPDARKAVLVPEKERSGLLAKVALHEEGHLLGREMHRYGRH